MHDFATNPAPNPAPVCPHCGKLMRVARIVPRLGGLPELRSYECRPCAISFTEAVEPGGGGGGGGGTCGGGRDGEDEVSHLIAAALRRGR